jgi:D-amino-acid dehydrogenase
MHYSPADNAVLNRPVVDVDGGFLLAPMTRGIRLTTGVEFAARDSAPTPRQLERTEPLAREIFPLESRVDEKVWMGSRPCLPDICARSLVRRRGTRGYGSHSAITIMA